MLAFDNKRHKNVERDTIFLKVFIWSIPMAILTAFFQYELVPIILFSPSIVTMVVRPPYGERLFRIGGIICLFSVSVLARMVFDLVNKWGCNDYDQR
ncbi:hypothetical protein QS257_00380 [Terrilactibacillus sp. S3-3]|nr:hypothetical protein QS257_00380 [Terrilactibacillus sp. S3-3]